MQFSSFSFLYFYVLVFCLYWVLRGRAQKLLLLGASYVFYGYWDWRFLSLLWLSTVIDYFAGRAIAATDDQPKRRHWLVLSLVTNLGLLFTFKYFGWFTASLIAMLKTLGVNDPPISVIYIVLPIGISFYTFQTISYTIDVYRRQQEPCRDPLDFAIFVALFPQLLSGPIERAKNLLPQISGERRICEATFWLGLWWIMFGLVKKVVIAENLVPFTKPMLGHPTNYEPVELLTANYIGMAQVYCDFSGYSDMAIGLGLLLGFKLSLNFRQPLLANNPTELWRRWHITFYLWLRDYIYFPLINGNWWVNRKVAKMVVAVTLTFLFAGLWHGADGRFLIWAMSLAGLLIAHRLALPVLTKISTRLNRPRLWRVIGTLTFFHLWMPVSLFFGSPTTKAAWQNLTKAYSFDYGPPNSVALATFAIFFGPLLVFEIWQERSGEEPLVNGWSTNTRMVLVLLMIILVMFCGVSATREFEYFQF